MITDRKTVSVRPGGRFDITPRSPGIAARLDSARMLSRTSNNAAGGR